MDKIRSCPLTGLVKLIFRFRVTRQGNWCLGFDEEMLQDDDDEDEDDMTLKIPQKFLSRKKSHKTNKN